MENNLVNHTEVPDVYGNLWVVNGFENINDSFFYLCLFFLCHNFILFSAKVTIIIDNAKQMVIYFSSLRTKT